MGDMSRFFRKILTSRAKHPRTVYFYDHKEAATNLVLGEVLEERARQDLKWGEQNHGNQTWLSILIEEVGELSTGILQENFSDSKDYAEDTRGPHGVRAEAVQVAAVAVAMIESIDRRNWREKA